MKKNLPNSVAVLVLGILSIVTGCAGVGLALGIIAVAMATKPRNLYKENPQEWDNYGMVKAGWICGIIGIVLSSISILNWNWISCNMLNHCCF